MTRTQAYLYLLLVSIIIIVAAGILMRQTYVRSPGTDGTPVVEGTSIPQPPLSDAERMQLEVNHDGPMELISYTDKGFVPKNVSVHSGDTLRFTNNSHGKLWVSVAGGAAAYPAGANGCGTSAFDSCRAMEPGEFWELTVDAPGTWPYVNNLDKTNVGIVNVQ